MDLQSLKVQKLFGYFDYTVSLNQQEGITILTGPNGYGKTTILNIIYQFFKQNFYYFQKLNFQDINFYFSGDKRITIYKKKSPHESSFVDVYLELKNKKKTIEKFVFNYEIEKKLSQDISRLYSSMENRYKDNLLYDSNTKSKIEKEEFFSQIPQKIFDIVDGLAKKTEIAQLILILSSADVYFIKAQRLLKQLNIVEKQKKYFDYDDVSFPHTIQHYAKELKKLIEQSQVNALKEIQEIDNSFLNRLMQNQEEILYEEYNERFLALVKKQEQLRQIGITIFNVQVPEYNSKKADVLSVYLNDLEKKMSFFDDLVKKINLFITMINKKEFHHKKIIAMNGEFGFMFIADKEEVLDLTALSSGEQQEVVFLYELIFKIQPNTLILIDEPEISLHVLWQKFFIKNLISIIDIHPTISFILATHSPQIVNGCWDLVTDLYKIANGEVSSENE